MWKNLSILLLLLVIIVLPFALRQKTSETGWATGDPVLVIISPHTESIRHEFEEAFSRWHFEKFGKHVKIDWRNIGGTSEITRYLASEYSNAGNQWLKTHAEFAGVSADQLIASSPPSSEAGKSAFDAFRATDGAEKFTSKIDLFFGGGSFDHQDIFRKGMTVPPWAKPSDVPTGLFTAPDGTVMIPEKLSGEPWRTATYFGNAVSTFGLVYNLDRMRDLGITPEHYPAKWDDLADPRYIRQVGICDPTKSGSIAKAFEMLVHQKMHDRIVADLRLDDDQIAANEKRIDAFIKQQGPSYPRGDVPDDLIDYERSLENGWLDGMALVQKIGGNARYFTDSGSKVAIDVGAGDAAVGMSIDFYGRCQAQDSRDEQGHERMVYVTPVGGTSVSADPISLMRGAEHREVAVRFIEFLLAPEGQRLWNTRPGLKDADGHLIGPAKYSLRRLPVRREFYPSTQPALQATHEAYAKQSVDNLGDPTIDPYQLAKQFTYYPRWTASHFGIQRDIVRCMCLDSGEELRAAWAAINDCVDPVLKEKALAAMLKMPTISLQPINPKTGIAIGDPRDIPLTWRTAPEFRSSFEPLDVTRKWTSAFRENYRAAREIAEGKNQDTTPTGESGTRR